MVSVKPFGPHQWTMCFGSVNVVAGRNAAEFDVAEQVNIARRIVDLRVFSARAILSIQSLYTSCQSRVPTFCHQEISPNGQ